MRKEKCTSLMNVLYIITKCVENFEAILKSIFSYLLLKQQSRIKLLMLSSADYSRRIHKMVENDHGHMTRVLFCGGSYFPASQIFTREYLQSYPYIQVVCLPILLPIVVNWC